MNPLLAALVQAGLMSSEEAARIERQLSSDAAREYAEQQLLLAFQGALAGQRDRLLDAVRDTDGLLTLAQQERLWAGENERLWNALRETVLDIVAERATVAAISAGGLDTWNLINEQVIDWAEEYYIDADGETYGSIPNLNLTSRTEFQRRFVEWQRGELGVSGRTATGELREGLDALIVALEPIFGAERAERIATTEVSRIFAQAELTAARASEFVEYLMYEASVDERVCFPAGTMVATQDGTQPIETIKPGAMVWTRQGLRKVIATSKRRYSGPMTTVQTALGDVTATASHPFWTLEQGWLECGNLTRQHTLQTFRDEPVKVFGVFNSYPFLHELHLLTKLYHKESSDATYVYDLQVEEVPEFYANGILVHNCSICGPRHGTVVRKDATGFAAATDDIVSYPPVHVRCRCRIVSLTGPALEALREEGMING